MYFISNTKFCFELNNTHSILEMMITNQIRQLPSPCLNVWFPFDYFFISSNNYTDCCPVSSNYFPISSNKHADCSNSLKKHTNCFPIYSDKHTDYCPNSLNIYTDFFPKSSKKQMIVFPFINFNFILSKSANIQ